MKMISMSHQKKEPPISMVPKVAEKIPSVALTTWLSRNGGHKSHIQLQESSIRSVTIMHMLRGSVGHNHQSSLVPRKFGCHFPRSQDNIGSERSEKLLWLLLGVACSVRVRCSHCPSPPTSRGLPTHIDQRLQKWPPGSDCAIQRRGRAVQMGRKSLVLKHRKQTAAAI